MEDIETTVKDFVHLLPQHTAGLTLEHNPHLSYYQTVEEWIEKRYVAYDDTNPWDSFVDKEEYEKAVRLNDVWELHWYPHTLVAHYVVRASTLEALLVHVFNNKDYYI